MRTSRVHLQPQARSAGLVALMLMAAACGRHHYDHSGQDVDVNSTIDSQEFTAHLTEAGTKVPFETVEQKASLALIGLPILSLGAPTITLAASLTTPTSNGLTLQANGIVFNGTLAYVSYNYQGETPAGAIDVIDISTPAHPKLVSEAIFPTSDINGLAIENGFLYAVGDTSTSTTTAFLSKITLSSGLLTNTITTVPLDSYAGTSVALSSGLVYVTSGDNGSVRIFNKSDLSSAASLPLKDARGILYSTSDSAAWVVSGKPGTLTEVSPSGQSLKTIAVGGNTIAQSKSTIYEISPGVLLASLGDGGAAAVCKSTGTNLASIPAVIASGVAAAKTVTNAATYLTSGLATYLFTANGEAGVYGYGYTSLSGLGLCLSLTLGLSGHLALGSGQSANSVYGSGTTLFVSGGVGGIQILNLGF